MTDDTFDAGTFAINADLARASVDWFVDSHGAQGDAYRLLACYAAMPLVLTPELLNYLHNRFLAHLGLPWVAEVDLLLSDLLRPVDAELYAMPPATRAYLLDELRRRAGEVEMQRVARVLIHYTRHLARTNPYLDDEELRTQQWAAMVYLDETRATAAREVAEAFAAVTTQLAAQPVTAPLDVQRAEFARLAHITRLLAPQLREHRALVEYAALVRRLLAGAEHGVSDFTAQVEGVTLRVPEQLRPQPAPTTSGSGVDVKIQISLAPDGIYTVAIRAMGEQSGFSRSFDATAAARLATCLRGDTAEAGAARDLRVLGETLYDFLIAGGDDGLLYRALVRGSGQGGTTLRLQIDPPDLAALPWEALHDGRGFLALGDDFSVIRTLPRSQPARPLASGAPLRIVAAAADPTDASPTLDQALERERVMQALAPLQAVGLAQITWLENATVNALYTALQEDADIFYFSGHGGFEPERGGGLLLLAGEAGGAQPVDAGDLTSLLAKRADLRLAILNTDLSAHGDATTPALAAALVQAGLPAAIGMQGTISDTGAIRFAQRLFDALARGRTVGAAVQAARRELAAAEPESFEWVLPVLYTSAPDEALVAAETLRDAMPAPRRAELAELERLIARSPRLEAIDLSLVAVTLKASRATVGNIMVRRVDVVALPADTDVEIALATMLKSGHGHIPVYGDSIDDVRGMLNAETLLETLRTQRTSGPIGEILQAAFFVPERMHIVDTFQAMQERGSDAAVVIDEYGGMAGLLALADILAQIVAFDWVEIPAGPFLMGSDKRKDDQAYDDELPQHTMTLPAYRMARMPVMVAQFAAFVEATGYMTQAEQQGSAYVWTGQKWDDVKGANWRHPRGPESDVRQKQEHPVTCVTFADSAAFCEWASKATGTTVRLPSEAEWEKAARGTDGRIYPWGDDKPTKELCNFGSSVGTTTPVGAYPKGASPFGVLDMAGNVWERTSTKWVGNYANYRPDDSPEGDATRTVRGGSFFFNVRFVRCACRNYLAYPRDNVGFRVVSPGF